MFQNFALEFVPETNPEVILVVFSTKLLLGCQNVCSSLQKIKDSCRQ